MPALTCPYCGAFANFTPRSTIFEGQAWRAGGGQVDMIAWTCDACIGPVVGSTYPGSRSRILWHEPKKAIIIDFPDVPIHIASDAGEAFRCFGVDAWRATVAIARRAVQAAAIQQGAPDKKLYDQINWLDEERKITPQMRELAHEIRLSGNDGAHPDRDGLQEVGKDQARAVLAFLREFLHHLYQVPANLERARARAKAVDGPPSPATLPEKDPDRWAPQPGP